MTITLSAIIVFLIALFWNLLKESFRRIFKLPSHIWLAIRWLCSNDIFKDFYVRIAVSIGIVCMGIVISIAMVEYQKAVTEAERTMVVLDTVKSLASDFIIGALFAYLVRLSILKDK